MSDVDEPHERCQADNCPCFQAGITHGRLETTQTRDDLIEQLEDTLEALRRIGR